MSKALKGMQDLNTQRQGLPGRDPHVGHTASCVGEGAPAVRLAVDWVCRERQKEKVGKSGL